MDKYCTGCGELFEAKADYHRLCWKCWKQQQTEDQQDETDEQASQAFWDGYRAGQSETARKQSSGRLSQEQKTLLLRLCHPDLHPPERCELATKAAQLINSL